MKNLLKRLDKKRLVLLITSLSILFVLAVGTTLAYLFTHTDPIVNTFTPSTVGIDIEEKTGDYVKKDVKITNNGDIDVYVRAIVVVSWKDDSGNVYATAPVEGIDYTVKWTKEGWVEKDGVYYYTSPVKPGKFTGILLTDCKPVKGNAPEGYKLSVEILSSAIQAEPTNAVEDAWGVTVNEYGTLSIVSIGGDS